MNEARTRAKARAARLAPRIDCYLLLRSAKASFNYLRLVLRSRTRTAMRTGVP